MADLGCQGGRAEPARAGDGRDQFEVAERVADTGAGTSVPATELNSADLRDAVQHAMTMRSTAQQLAASFARAGGAPPAATSTSRTCTDR